MRREASSAEDTTAKPRVLLLINLSLLVGLGRCRFELLYGNVLGRYFVLLAITTLRTRKLGTNFVPQEFLLRNTTQHHSARMRNHEMKKVGHHK